MKIPVTKWVYSRETEAQRVLHAAAQTANRFYPKIGFLVLPRLISGNPRFVYLPQFDYQQIPDFWVCAARTDNENLILHGNDLSKQLETLIPTESIDYSGLLMSWQKIEKDFWLVLYQLFPWLSGKIIKVMIMPTKYGTNTSFSVTSLKQLKITIIIWVREDQFPCQLAEGIISSLFSQDVWINNIYTWNEREAFVDLLMTNTPLAELFPDYQGTLLSLRTQEEAKLAKESVEYLKSLRLPTGEVFKFKSNQIMINNQPLRNLTKQEWKLMELLIKSQNQLVSLNQIGDVLWKDNEEKFSPWAMTKLVERLRKKLRNAGVCPELIQTQRGRGYLLIN